MMVFHLHLSHTAPTVRTIWRADGGFPVVRKSSLSIAGPMDLNVQFVEIVSLIPEWYVVASENNIQNTVKFLASRNALQSLLQKHVRFGEAGGNLRVVARAAGDVIVRIVRIEDGNLVLAARIVIVDRASRLCGQHD